VYLIPANSSQHFSSFFTQHPSLTLENTASAKNTSQLPGRQLYRNRQKFLSEVALKTFYSAGFSVEESNFAGGEIEPVSASSLFSPNKNIWLEDDSRRGLLHFAPEPALAQNDH